MSVCPYTMSVRDQLNRVQKLCYKNHLIIRKDVNLCTSYNALSVVKP